MLVGVLVALAAVGLVWRERRVSALTAYSMSRRIIGGGGIAVGAEAFTLEHRDGPAVLLLHGAGDTPQTLRRLGAHLHARGFHVSAPLLPGHGRSVRDFRRVRADEWLRAARSAYAELRATHTWVGVIGLSMGGALAVQIAAESPDLAALGLAAPYLEMPARLQRLARTAWLWGLLVPIVDSSDGVSVLDSDERERSLAYGVFTAQALRALHETVRRAALALPRVASPTIVVQSREDNRISVSAAERAFARLGAKEKRLEWISGAAHVITVDFGREHVFELLTSWLEQHRATAPTR